MCLKKIPAAAFPLTLNQIIFPRNSANVPFFSSTYSDDVIYYDSGIGAYLHALNFLKSKFPEKTEVIVPAYTAGSLIVAIRQAGLTPVLCDIDIKTFNVDLHKVRALIRAKTLAFTPVHMFGLPLDIKPIKKAFPNLLIIEDFCQAMGSKLNMQYVGKVGQISFTSFNKGKNFPLFKGGALIFNNKELAKDFKKFIEKEKVFLEAKENVFKEKLFLIILCVLQNSFFYALLSPFIESFKDKKPPSKITINFLSEYRKNVLAEITIHEKLISQKRSLGVALLKDCIKHNMDIDLFESSWQDLVALNRFPILIKDEIKLKILEKRVQKAGFEVSRMYEKPLHLMFGDLGYSLGDFPIAEDFAKRLLVLPCHPCMGKNDLAAMVKIIAEKI